MKVHVELIGDDLKILDIFCKVKQMTRAQVLRYVWKIYLTSEKIMSMENEQREYFARQQDWETKKNKAEQCVLPL